LLIVALLYEEKSTIRELLFVPCFLQKERGVEPIFKLKRKARKAACLTQTKGVYKAGRLTQTKGVYKAGRLTQTKGA
jgi:hypothetical protein